jgi:predicted DNA-binding transcriptional regulator AlpA
MSEVTDTKGAATRTGLSVATLEKKRVYGNGPAFLKLGRSVRYRVADLDRWLAEHQLQSTSSSFPSTAYVMERGL